MTLFRNKYRIEPARMKNWDYSNAGAYFITMCTHNKTHFFGEMKMDLGLVETQSISSQQDSQDSSNKYIQLSKIGKIVELEWLKTPEIRMDMNLKLGEYVIMPDHFHAIIIIGENQYNQRPSLSPNTYGAQGKNLASIVRGFKSAVTIQVRALEPQFKWQTRFHDRIIRNLEEYERIEKYILSNPQNWSKSEF